MESALLAVIIVLPKKEKGISELRPKAQKSVYHLFVTYRGTMISKQFKRLS